MMTKSIHSKGIHNGTPRSGGSFLTSWGRWMAFLAVAAGVVALVPGLNSAEPAPADEMKVAMTDKGTVPETQAILPIPNRGQKQLPSLAGDPEAIQAGKRIFDINCSRCHGPDGSGGLGPSFQDDVQIHGTAYEDIVNTITNGVKDKPMLSWKDILDPLKIRQVAAYVQSLKGTNNAKPTTHRYTLM